jgi:hypothetical protein
MEDNTIKDLVSDMLSSIVLGDKPEEEQVTSTGLMSSLPGVRTPTQTQQQEQEAAPKARDKVKEFILRLSDEAEDTNSLRYSEKAAPEITDVMVDSETLLNRYDTPLYVYARNLRDYNPERSTIKVRNRGDHSERFLDQMYELARQSSEEAALARMEMGITESLPRSAPRVGFDVQGLIDAVNKDMTLRVETEELDDEEVAILSDTDIDTDDADGGAAPSDGKGLMSPSESLRLRARPDDKDSEEDRRSKLIDSVFKAEGGYSTDKKDQGNYWKGVFIGTNHGISAPILASVLGRDPTVEDMKSLSKEDAKEIAAKHYYDRFNIRGLPDELEEIVFHAVYMGESRGVRALQNLLDLTPDGVMGPATRVSMRNADFTRKEFAKEFLRELESGTEGYSKPSPTWNVHGKGWSNRFNKLAT